MTISVLLCVATIVTNYLGFDVTALAGLAGASLLTNGAWGGFYFWKAKNENISENIYAIIYVKHSTSAGNIQLSVPTRFLRLFWALARFQSFPCKNDSTSRRQGMACRTPERLTQ